MTPKMQREDAGSGFSFLFPAPLFTSQRWICHAGQPRELGRDPGLEPSTLIPALGGSWSLQLPPS